MLQQVLHTLAKRKVAATCSKYVYWCVTSCIVPVWLVDFHCQCLRKWWLLLVNYRWKWESPQLLTALHQIVYRNHMCHGPRMTITSSMQPPSQYLSTKHSILEMFYHLESILVLCTMTFTPHHTQHSYKRKVCYSCHKEINMMFGYQSLYDHINVLHFFHNVHVSLERVIYHVHYSYTWDINCLEDFDAIGKPAGKTYGFPSII